jgi:hypothetical protein
MSLKFGYYVWSYGGGKFEVSLRPNGIFFCELYKANAKFTVENSILTIDWKNYGIYEFQLTNNQDVIEGSTKGNPSNWRKLEYLKEFSLTEKVLFGNSLGSIWNFIYEKGSFEVEFHADAYNHFVCKSFPAHSHWSVAFEGADVEPIVEVNWSQYGF